VRIGLSPHRNHVPESAAHDEGGAACANCGGTRVTRYCAGCGQVVRTGRHTLRSLLVDGLLKRGLNLESGFLYTAWRLTREPARVIREYLAGRTAAFTHPIAYLLISFAAVALLARLAGGYFGTGSSNRLLTALIVPFVAAVSWLVFIRARLSFAEHLIIALYLLGNITLYLSILVGLGALAAALPGAGPVLLVTMAFSAISYFVWAYSRLFDTRPVLAGLGGLLALLGGTVLWAAALFFLLELLRART
jgi:hypothetical protein